MIPFVTRFAPSPTGHLHLGSAYAALVAWRRARETGGRFLLRMEDIDTGRCRPEYASSILEDLHWLGLDWDGDVRVQSAHFAAYEADLAALAGRGLVYPCFCTRGEIAREVALSASAPHAPDGSPLYPGTCRRLPAEERARRIAAGVPHALRLDMAGAVATAGPGLTFFDERAGTVHCRPEAFGDVVLGRRDTPASYHLCVTHDDAAQNVTLVTRGEDLLAATHIHRLLQALMGWPTPRYAHHGLRVAADGRRLAKRDGAVAIHTLRARGMTPAQVLRLAESGV